MGSGHESPGPRLSSVAFNMTSSSITIPLTITAVSTSILALFRLIGFFRQHVLPFFTTPIEPDKPLMGDRSGG